MTSIFTKTALTASVVNVKTAPGWLSALVVGNPNAAASYVQLFNSLAANVSLGTTVPYACFYIPANSNLVLAFGANVDCLPEFPVALSIAATTTSTGSSAPSSNLPNTVIYV